MVHLCPVIDRPLAKFSSISNPVDRQAIIIIGDWFHDNQRQCCNLPITYLRIYNIFSDKYKCKMLYMQIRTVLEFKIVCMTTLHPSLGFLHFDWNGRLTMYLI